MINSEALRQPAAYSELGLLKGLGSSSSAVHCSPVPTSIRITEISADR